MSKVHNHLIIGNTNSGIIDLSLDYQGRPNIEDIYKGGSITEKLGSLSEKLEIPDKPSSLNGGMGSVYNQLSSVEREIFDTAFKQKEEDGTIVFSEIYKNLDPRLAVDSFCELTMRYNKLLDNTPDNLRFYYSHLIGVYIPSFRSVEPQLFFLPPDFKKASFETFEILCEAQDTAWTLLTHFGPSPPRGLYLFGNYGSGKTHLISAFARGLLAELTCGYIGNVKNFVSESIISCESFLKANGAQNETIPKRGWEKIGSDMGKLDKIILDNLSRAKQAYPFHPSDLAFATFDYLFDRRQEDDLLNHFLEKKVMIIDDIHPKHGGDRLDFIQRIIEHRYNHVRTGATFITSNLSPEQLLLNQDYPKEIAERVYSRLREMCMPIEFKTEDYRLKIGAKADGELLDLAKRIQQQRER